MKNAVAIGLMSLLSLGAWAADTDEMRQEGLSLIKQFGSTLKPSLKAAMQSGGPVAAVEVCASQAPMIAAQLASQSGWQLSRVSLKPRNAKMAQADLWEAQVLAEFEQRLLAGAAPKSLVTERHQPEEFRLMKGIVIEKVCLQCHGQQLAPEVQQAIAEHYPSDQATGYELGQLRGAFSVRRSL
ncbi:Tll0287-like domain-containing protein [Ferrimonas sp.]|uniref:Tll0287-like domain-containing protein n=1 Tax=Ferrimonas sp. TaxID=2080861 RepID=UPI003A8C9799